MSNAVSEVNWDAKRAQWASVVEALISDISGWCQSQGWTVAQMGKELREDGLGEYSLPTLHIRTGSGTIIIDPVARNVIGADGRVDILDFPSLNRFILVRRGAQWVLYTDAMVKWPLPWGEQTFVQLAKELNSPT